MQLQVGTKLQGQKGAYLLKELHGEGGFGLTFRAEREGDQKEVIVKLLKLERLKEWKSLELFTREARVLESLSHPNIPAYIDDFSLGDAAYPEALALVQEFLPGKNLAQLMREGKRLTEGEMISWFSQILEALDYLHRLSPPVIHRDVNPKNIILRPDGKAFLVDFGTVQAAVASSTFASTSAGTFGYAPMEQFMGRAFPASDLYGLAMTYLAVASGKEPEEMPLDGVRVSVREVVKADARLSLLLELMTEPDPRRRLSSAALALERIRPLRHRYAVPGAGGAAQAVVQQERARRDRPITSMDDLLPSEQLREAAARLAAIPPGKALSSPPALEWRSIDAAAVSPDGLRLYVADDSVHWLIDTRDLSWTRLPPLSQDCERASFNATGEKLAVLIRSIQNYAITLLDLRNPGQPPPKYIPLGGGIWMNDVTAAVSPDGNLVAASTRTREPSSSFSEEYCLYLYEWESRRLVQQLSDVYGVVTGFSPDGRYVICRGQERIILLGQEGARTEIEGKSLCFSPDGRLLALVQRRNSSEPCSLYWGEVAALEPKLSWNPKKLSLQKVDAEEPPCFSPDGHLLAVSGYGDLPRLIEVQSGKEIPLERRDLVLKSNYASKVLGFSSDAERLFVFARLEKDRFTDDQSVVLSWEIPSGRYLGALALVYENQLVLRTPLGFYGRLSSRRRRGRGGEEQSPWERAALAKEALLGAREEELLTPEERARLQDFEARWAFWEELRRGEKIPKDTDLKPLLDASVGLTHVLPLIVREARAAQETGPRFGVSSSGSAPLTVDLLLAAAQKLRARSEEELRVLHEELVADCEAAERQKAESARAMVPSVRTEEEDPEALYQQALKAEAKEDRRWFFRKKYDRALALFERAAALGHPEAPAAVERVRGKLAPGS